MYVANFGGAIFLANAWLNELKLLFKIDILLDNILSDIRKYALRAIWKVPYI